MASLAFQVLIGLCVMVLASADEDYKPQHPPTPPATTTTPRTTPRPGCIKTSDCPYGNCCLLDKTTNRGVCTPQQATRQTCYWSQVNPRPDPQAMVTKYDICPCAHGMACTRLEGKRHTVFGPIGICTWND